MSALCELEEKHGVNLGTGYKNDIACAEFVSYISKAELEKLTCMLTKAKLKQSFLVSRYNKTSTQDATPQECAVHVYSVRGSVTK